MIIYLDESGSFVNAPTVGSWNVVAALATTEKSDLKIREHLDIIKTSNHVESNCEVKLNGVKENTYFQFLSNLVNLDAVLFAIATDSGLNSRDKVIKHQERQKNEILKHIDKMKYEEGRRGVEAMALQIQELSPQLYVQLICQIELMYDVVSRSINYFAQRCPETLKQFKWIIDQKGIDRTNFDDAFEKLSPAILQTMSIRKPMPWVEGFDYSYLSRYEFKDGKPPSYLKEAYGIDVRDGGIDINRIIRGDIHFIDSKTSHGLQAIDLIVSGIRRCFRGQFLNNDKAAILLGNLMLQAEDMNPPIFLKCFNEERPLVNKVAKSVKLMSKNCKKMIL